MLLQRIEEYAYSYADSRRIVGEFLLNEKSRVEKYSMKEIAEKTFSSKTTLVRFAQGLGFDGWSKFIQEFLKETYYEEKHYSDIDVNFPFDELDPIKDIVYKVANLQVESILDTADKLDLEELEHAVQLLMKANQIAVLGQTPNSYLGKLFARKMMAIEKPILITDSGEQGLLVSSLKSQDCAIVISYSGNNEYRIPINLLSDIKARQASIIAITGVGDNLLRQNADCTLSMSSRERLYNKISGFATEEAISLILNILYSCYFQLEYKDNLIKKNKTSQHFESRFSTNVEMREPNKDTQ